MIVYSSPFMGEFFFLLEEKRGHSDTRKNIAVYEMKKSTCLFGQVLCAY